MIHQLRTELHNQRREKEQNGELDRRLSRKPGVECAVVTDENLMMEYPACVYTFADGRRVIALAPEMEEAVPEIPEDASLNEVLDILFDLSEITVHPERVTGFYAPADFPANGEELRTRTKRDFLR